VEVLANTGDGRAERGGVHDEIPRDVVHGRLPGADLVEAERRMAGDVRAVVARGAGAVELAEVGEKAGALRGGRRGAVRAGGGHRGPLWEDGPRGGSPGPADRSELGEAGEDAEALGDPIGGPEDLVARLGGLVRGETDGVAGLGVE